MICTMSKGSQITIPAEWRAELGLAPEKKFNMNFEGDKIIIQPLNNLDDDIDLNALNKMIEKSPRCTLKQIMDGIDDVYS